MSQDLHERETPVFDLHRKTGFRTGGRAEDDTVDAMLPHPPHQGFLPLRQVRAIGENDHQSRRIDHRFYSPQQFGEEWIGEVGNDDAHRSAALGTEPRSEEHTSELQSLMSIPYAVFCLKK